MAVPVFVGTFSKNFNVFLLIPIVVPKHMSGVKSFSSSNVNHILLLSSANIRPFTQRNWYLCTMNVLVVTATKEELSLALDNHLVSGVGMVSTAIAVTNALKSKRYDLVINAGVAGSFNRSLELGDVVEVNEDYLSELGAQDGSRFLTPEEMNFEMKNRVQMPKRTQLKSARGITVNTVHGNELSIMKIVHRLNPQVESMEGAACMLACQEANVPCVQIRSISNYVEKRNKSKWDMTKAITNLNKELQNFISTL